MNRILLESSNKKSIDIKEDINILIDSKLEDKYVFNIYNSNLNLLIISKNAKTTFEINIYEGNLSFNNISYNNNQSITINLNKKNSNALIHNSVISSDKNKYDIRVNHNYKYTNSYVYNNGITKDNGTIMFNVTSYAKALSIKSNINQDSKIITLNKINNNLINPILLIDEYDTESKHSAFIGNFKDDELFYLMSRGLSKKDASKLLIDGLLIGTLDISLDEKEKIRKILKDDWR